MKEFAGDTLDNSFQYKFFRRRGYTFTSNDLCMSVFSPVAPTVTWLKYFKRDSITVRVGAAIEIPAEIVGLPLPTFEWSKDGVVFPAKDKLPEEITIEDEEVNRTTIRTKISIPKTVRADHGAYTLTARNCHGKAEPKIKVEVLGKTFLFVYLKLSH